MTKLTQEVLEIRRERRRNRSDLAEEKEAEAN